MSGQFMKVIDRVLGHEGGYVDDPGKIASAIKDALNKRSNEAQSIFIAPKNSRDYACSMDGCVRPAYASGYCNAHYLRFRKNMPMATPIRARKRDDLCCECGEKTGAKGGWGLCSKHYKKNRYQIIKNALIELMGGKCSCCGNRYPTEVYDFHHVEEKEDEDPSHIIGSKSVEKIAEEMTKCVLVCANCHRTLHKCL